LRAVGTIGHRYISFYDTEEEAFERAINSLDSVTILIDLSDPWKGIEKALTLKAKYRHTGKKIWIRIDSGEKIPQVLYILRKYKEMGFTDPLLDKVVVEDLHTVDEMQLIDMAVAQEGFDVLNYIVHGGGGLLVTQDTQRANASSAYKSSLVNTTPKSKFSGDKGKASIPGRPELYVVEKKRIIGQENEIKNGRSLFKPVYRVGRIKIREDFDAVRQRVMTTFEEIKPYLGKKSELSEETENQLAVLRRHYGLEA
jgi:nicotinic acid phosphoribosyltransferase